MTTDQQMSLPVESWPIELQQRWQECPTTWSSSTKKQTRLEAGRLFRFLRDNSREITEIDADQIDAYLTQRLTHLRPKSASSAARQLFDALTVLFPDHQFGQLVQRMRKIRAEAYSELRRPPRPRLDRHTCSLPIEAWPDEDRVRWNEARNPASRRARRTSRIARWKESSARYHARCYGVLLKFLSCRGESAANITPAAIDAWVANCHTRNLSERTISNYVQGAFAVAAELYPERDWNWFREEAMELSYQAEPKRDKRQRLVHSAELAVLGRFIMQSARESARRPRAAVRFRKGLILYFLAYRPIRLENLANISLRENLFLEEAAARVEWTRQKNGDPLCYELPEELIGFICEYIAEYRPLLEGAETVDALWLSTRGPLTANAIEKDMKRLTSYHIGKDITPHLSRDAAATTIVEETPEAEELASRLLGHRNVRSTETYRQHAQTLLAQRRARRILAAYDAANAPVWVRRRLNVRP